MTTDYDAMGICRWLLLKRMFPALLVAVFLPGCISPIPDEVLDRDWCIRMEAAKAQSDERGRRNIASAMEKHRCLEKMR